MRTDVRPSMYGVAMREMVRDAQSDITVSVRPSTACHQPPLPQSPPH